MKNVIYIFGPFSKRGFVFPHGACTRERCERRPFSDFDPSNNGQRRIFYLHDQKTSAELGHFREKRRFVFLGRRSVEDGDDAVQHLRRGRVNIVGECRQQIPHRIQQHDHNDNYAGTCTTGVVVVSPVDKWRRTSLPSIYRKNDRVDNACACVTSSLRTCRRKIRQLYIAPLSPSARHVYDCAF